MVERRHSRHGIIYVCELCGFGYTDVDAAESCEEFCGLHGRYAANITARAVFRPRIQVVSVSN